MWVFYALLPTLIVLSIIVGGIVLLVRRGAEGWNIQFPGILLGYTAVAMLIGVFLVAAGAGLLLKTGFARMSGRDFSYDARPQTQYSAYPAPSSAPGARSTPPATTTIDPSDARIRDDVATGISLAFAGTVLFAVHGLGATVLRRRKAQGASLTSRAYNLTGLAVSTLGFLGTGSQALNDVVRRYVVGGDAVQPYQIRHPGEPLSIAIVLLPLMLWFGWRVWQELGGAASREPQRDAVIAPHVASSIA
ncbi:MAG: hypothetical protein M3P30_12560 [Chloroflexota bacterium]|nr:hypothetical protein [Chloroflexota bacterium]